MQRGSPCLGTCSPVLHRGLPRLREIMQLPFIYVLTIYLWVVNSRCNSTNLLSLRTWVMFTDEKHAEMITNLSEATVPDRGGSKLLLPKSKPPPASAAPFHGSRFGFRLFRASLWAFTSHGGKNSPTRVLLPQLLSHGLRPASVTEKNLWNSILLCIQASACLAFVSSIQNVPCVDRSPAYPETKRQLALGK